MSLSKKFAFFSNLLVHKLKQTKAPLTVIFNLTDECNLKCTYCYAGYYKRGKQELTTHQICQILDELVQAGCKRVSFAGGEPLLRQDFAEILTHCFQLGLDITVNSNGTFVPQWAERLKGIQALCLSLDGEKSAHDSYRGKNTYEEVLAAIQAAQAQGIPVLTNTTLHSKNTDQIEKVLALAEKHDFWALFNLAIGHIYNDRQGYKAQDEAIRQALTQLMAAKKAGKRVYFSAEAFRYSLHWPDYAQDAVVDDLPSFDYLKCYAGKFFATVDTDGKLYPCTHLTETFQAKNILEVGLKEAFANLDQHGCNACYQVCHNEFNMLFSLHPEVFKNYAIQALASAFKHQKKQHKTA